MVSLQDPYARADNSLSDYSACSGKRNEKFASCEAQVNVDLATRDVLRFDDRYVLSHTSAVSSESKACRLES